MPDDSNPFRLAGLQNLMGAGLSSSRNLDAATKHLDALRNDKKLNGLQQPGKAGAPTDDVAKAATEFEALLLHQMLNEMWKTVPKDGLFDSGQETELYRDMLNQGIANDIAEKQSLGIKDVVIRDMQKSLKK